MQPAFQMSKGAKRTRLSATPASGFIACCCCRELLDTLHNRVGSELRHKRQSQRDAMFVGRPSAKTPAPAGRNVRFATRLLWRSRAFRPGGADRFVDPFLQTLRPSGTGRANTVSR